MKKFWEDMMEKEQNLGESQTLIFKKLRSKQHSYYLYYDRVCKTGHLGIDVGENIPNGKTLPSCKGFRLELGTLPFIKGTNAALILSCNSEENSEIFLRVAEDLISFLSDKNDTGNFCNLAISRITLWQRFFKKHERLTMAEEKQKGLFGELLTIKKLSTILPINNVIFSWTGPKRQPHDFEFRSFHVETKLIIKRNPESVKIHGLDQLKVPNQKKLFIYLVSVKEIDCNGLSVIDLVGEIESQLKSDPICLENFHAKLLDYGYPLGGFENPIQMKTETEKYYNVDDQFPHLTGSTEIFAVEYYIPLATCANFQISWEVIEKTILGEICSNKSGKAV